MEGEACVIKGSNFTTKQVGRWRENGEANKETIRWHPSAHLHTRVGRDSAPRRGVRPMRGPAPPTIQRVV
jgi:hypothetical protein